MKQIKLLAMLVSMFCLFSCDDGGEAVDEPTTYCTITFETNGGSEMTAIEVEYGTYLTEPTAPTKDGYTFLGWFKDSELTTAWVFDTYTVTSSMTLYASWQEVTYSYCTILFDLDTTAIEMDSVEVEKGTAMEKPEDPYINSDFTFLAWYSDEALTKEWDFSTVIYTNMTLYASWQENWTYDFTTEDKTAAQSAAYTYISKLPDFTTYTIVDKVAVTPSGDKHDYISIGPYWWPTGLSTGDDYNPDEAYEPGVVWEQRDGETSPYYKTDYTDLTNLQNMTSAVSALGLAYACTSDETYITPIPDILRTFFLNAETLMNPNLNYGQGIPNSTDGRCFGIIESVSFLAMLDGVTYASRSRYWPSDVVPGLKEWFAEFNTWLTTNTLGIEERSTSNNHGTHYDRQVAGYYIFNEDYELATDYINTYSLPRIEAQIASDGSQPEELSRTKSWAYSIMNLNGWIDLADYAAEVGVDLWNYEKSGQVYLKSMIDWFIPYVRDGKEWTWDQITSDSINDIEYAFERAAEIYNDPSYLSITLIDALNGAPLVVKD